jgi:hypothetical protein
MALTDPPPGRKKEHVVQQRVFLTGEMVVEEEILTIFTQQFFMAGLLVSLCFRFTVRFIFFFIK